MRGITLTEILVLIILSIIVVMLFTPKIVRSRKKPQQTEAVSNARQIGLALFEFQTEYGRFPDDRTAIDVQKTTGGALITGHRSNDRFRQLVRAGIAQAEPMFYAKTAYTQKPDGVMGTDAKTLAAGEVGFGILMNHNNGLEAKGNPSRPIVAAPFTLAMDGTFDPTMYDGKAVFLKMDNSVTSLPILKASGHVKISGKNITETGPDTVWEPHPGDPPVVPTWAFPIPKP